MPNGRLGIKTISPTFDFEFPSLLKYGGDIDAAADESEAVMKKLSATGLEQEVMATLTKSPELPTSLVRNLKEQGKDETVVRHTIWRLIDQGKIRLNRERKLEKQKIVNRPKLEKQKVVNQSKRRPNTAR